MTRLLIATLLCVAPLLLAQEGHAAPRDVPRPLEAVESFEGTTPDSLLRSLYNQALAAFQEYIEIDGNLPQDGETQARGGEFRLKVFPQGKSRSQEHLSAEGSFRLSPDAEQQELTLRFKTFKHPSRSLPPGAEDII